MNMYFKVLNWGWSALVVASIGWLVFGVGEMPDSGVFQTQAFSKTVQQIGSEIPFVTRIKITPDDSLMFATTLDGKVYVFEKKWGRYDIQSQPFYVLETGYDFLSGDENGLTGFIISGDYASNKQIFLLYARKVDGVGKSQIMRLTVVRDENGDLVGSMPEVVFEGNVNANGAHQIQGGQSVKIEGISHLLFAIGESYIPSYARQLKREAGKILLIQENGDNPLGIRPYPDYPRVQAIGLRNVYDLDVIDGTNFVYMTDNGPDLNDRVLYASLLDGRQYDFGWNGNPVLLLEPTVDGEIDKNMVIFSWEITVTPVDIVVVNKNELIVNIFSTVRKPAKEILKIKHDSETTIVEVLVSAEPVDFGGNLLGLASDSKGRLYFSDFIGGIYRLS